MDRMGRTSSGWGVTCLRITRVALFACVALARVPAGHAEPEDPSGRIRGTVALGIEDTQLAALGPVVVFLDARAGSLDFPAPAQVPRISQKNAQFSPPFLVVARGQRVEMPNDDTIFHNVFSYSKQNELDLGLYRQGESRTITLRHPGAVRIYCSIHESMNAVIFVAPSPYHDLVSAGGTFDIGGVPAGSYRLRTWNEKLPEVARDVEIIDGRTTSVAIVIGPRT
jgi:plastocyanin